MIQSFLFELISVLFSQTLLSAVPNVHSPDFKPAPFVQALLSEG